MEQGLQEYLAKCKVKPAPRGDATSATARWIESPPWHTSLQGVLAVPAPSEGHSRDAESPHLQNKQSWNAKPAADTVAMFAPLLGGQCGSGDAPAVEPCPGHDLPYRQQQSLLQDGASAL